MIAACGMVSKGGGETTNTVEPWKPLDTSDHREVTIFQRVMKMQV